MVSVAGERLMVIGIDPLTLPGDSAFATPGAGDDLTAFFMPPGQTRLAPETAERLGREAATAPGATPALADGRRLPPLALAPRCRRIPW